MDQSGHDLERARQKERPTKTSGHLAVRGAPTFIRQTFVEFAKHSTRNCDWAKAFYQIKEEEGQPCQTILRALALKWTRILFRCWKNGESYDEQKYLQSLQRRGSPVWKRLQQVNANAL